MNQPHDKALDRTKGKIEVGRKLVGTASAKNAPPGTIRGDFTVDSYEIADAKQRPVRNLVHASGTLEEARYEVALWFADDEIFECQTAAERFTR